MGNASWKQLFWRVTEDASWTADDRIKARAEGWGLYCSNQERGALQSSDNLNDEGFILTDEQAVALVRAGTKPVHIKALHIAAKLRLLT